MSKEQYVETCFFVPLKLDETEEDLEERTKKIANKAFHKAIVESNADPKWTEEQRRELEQIILPKPDQRSKAWYNEIYNHL